MNHSPTALVVAASLVLIIAGPVGLGVVVIGWTVRRWCPRRKPTLALRPILVVLLVELRSGLSVLGALRAVAGRLPEYRALGRSVRIASVVGLAAAAEAEEGQLRRVLAHLARSQAAGTSAADAVRRMIESELAEERARRMSRARALPVRLMVPVSLLILPGVILISYGPTVISLLEGLAVPFG